MWTACTKTERYYEALLCLKLSLGLSIAALVEGEGLLREFVGTPNFYIPENIS